MLQFSPWKKATILGLCLIGVILALPNLFYSRADDAARARAEISRLEEAGTTVPAELEDQASVWPGFLPPDVVNLGLDLRGGAHLLVEVRVEEVVVERMESLRTEMRQALRDGGIRRFTNLRADDDHVSVRITNAEEVERAGQVLRDMAQPVGGGIAGGFGMGGIAAGVDLEISETGDQSFRVELSEPAISALTDRTMAQSLEIVRRRIDEAGTREPTIQRQGERRILVQVPGIGSADELLGLIGKTAKLTFHAVEGFGADAQNPGPGQFIARSPEGEDFLLERRAILTGENLVDAQLGFHHQNGLPVVNFRFDAVGARIFGDYTSANVGQLFATVLDEAVITAPRIQSPILGGAGFIEGNFTVESATELAILLRAGALPASIEILQQRTIGPDLGADSISAGKAATLLAFGAVLIFMALVYRRFGLFANIALITNVALIFGLLSVVGATLTLPGIAGIVLTIGMAVDANVLIFERIREELRSSKKISRAIERGYEQAFSAIIDANITTLIAAVILFAMGSGPVKGFAVTLGIGIVTSVFTATLFTRLMVVAWLERARPKTLEVARIKLVPEKTKINFLGLRRAWVTVSCALVAGSILLAAILGLNFGIDFRGGTMMIAGTPDKVEISSYRDTLNGLDIGDVSVTEISSPAEELGADSRNSVMIRVEQQGNDPEIQQDVILAVKAALGDALPGVQFLATEAVGAKVSAELLQAGIIAVALAVLAVLIYIWLRFEWQFGLGAVIALVHDVALTIGAFALFQIEFNLSIIAAILTIVGYSLNDTVVVFDRVRENLRKYKKMPLLDLLNQSVNETLSRTLMTSITTLIALIAMFVLGPAVIQGFTFAMILGIIIGTYSSIFVAAVTLVWLGVKRDWSTGEEAAKAGVQFGGAQV